MGDHAIAKAVHLDPFKRYGELSEFIYDLHHPNNEYLTGNWPPLMERNPVAFRKGVAVVHAAALAAAL